MLVVRNDDVPGIIGMVGTLLGKAGVNIDDMDVGRSPTGAAAMMAISTTDPVPTDVVAELRARCGCHRRQSHRAGVIPGPDRQLLGRARRAVEFCDSVRNFTAAPLQTGLLLS